MRLAAPEMLLFQGMLLGLLGSSIRVHGAGALEKKKPKMGAEGCSEGDCEDGMGVYNYPNGDVYFGKFHRGFRHGNGILIFNDGRDKYDGEWIAGRRSGEGKEVLKSVDMEKSGQFYDDELHGIARIKYSDGSSYQGSWERGKRHGRGSFWSSDSKNVSFLSLYPYVWLQVKRNVFALEMGEDSEKSDATLFHFISFFVVLFFIVIFIFD